LNYGRRDHAYDWREAILNPETMRGPLLGRIFKNYSDTEVMNLFNERGDFTTTGVHKHFGEISRCYWKVL